MATRERAALPASGLAAIVAVLIGFVVVHETSLEKSRPGEKDKPTYQLLDLQDAEARLWQDPFAAGQAHQEALDRVLKEHPAGSGSTSAAQHAGKAADGGSQDAATSGSAGIAEPSLSKAEQADAEARLQSHLKRHLVTSLRDDIRNA